MRTAGYAEPSVEEMEAKARAIRQHIVKVICNANVGHAGGSLSATDILTALYFKIMRIDPSNPDWSERDRFVLSKGHAATALYSTLAERGYLPVDELYTFATIDSQLQTHPALGKPAGVEFSTGPLGQGLSAAIGMALGAKLDGKDFRVYALLGDGEIQEGQIWEAAMFAAHHKVDNLTAILDYNCVQLSGRVCDIMEIAPVVDKWRAFGWRVFEVDGHSIRALIGTLQQAREVKGQPAILVAHTIKGKGVSFMEGKAEWHGKVPSEGQLCQALAELEEVR